MLEPGSVSREGAGVDRGRYSRQSRTNSSLLIIDSAPEIYSHYYAMRLVCERGQCCYNHLVVQPKYCEKYGVRTSKVEIHVSAFFFIYLLFAVASRLILMLEWSPREMRYGSSKPSEAVKEVMRNARIQVSALSRANRLQHA